MLVAGCNAPNATADFPTDSCDNNVASTIEPQPGVKPSDHLARVERLACFYGMSVETARAACIVNPDAPEYFGDTRNSTTYGLKDRTAALLIEAESYGKELANKRTLWTISHDSDPHNEDLCLSKIHDLPESFAMLVDNTTALRRYEY